MPCNPTPDSGFRAYKAGLRFDFSLLELVQAQRLLQNRLQWKSSRQASNLWQRLSQGILDKKGLRPMPNCSQQSSSSGSKYLNVKYIPSTVSTVPKYTEETCAYLFIYTHTLHILVLWTLRVCFNAAATILQGALRRFESKDGLPNPPNGSNIWSHINLCIHIYIYVHSFVYLFMYSCIHILCIYTRFSYNFNRVYGSCKSFGGSFGLQDPSREAKRRCRGARLLLKELRHFACAWHLRMSAVAWSRLLNLVWYTR